MGHRLFRDSHYDLGTPKGSWIVLQAISFVTQKYLSGGTNQYGQTTGLADIESVIEDAVDVFTGKIEDVIMTPFYSREMLGTRLIVRFELDPKLLDSASFRTVVRHALNRFQRAMAQCSESGAPTWNLMVFAHHVFYNWREDHQRWARISDFLDGPLAPPLDST